tara:strand:+ start:1047 stop:1646 length:600 start_codon:yes stop_codon:yes gene_type:complete
MDNDKLIEANQNKIDSESSNGKIDNDSDDILKKDYIENDAPKYNLNLFGLEYALDKSTVLTFVPGLFLVVAIFFALKMQNSDCVGVKITFVMSVFFWIFEIHNRRKEKIQHISGESASMTRARDSAIVIMSIITLFTVFGNHRDPLLGFAILILTFGSFWFTFEDEPDNYRFGRNVHVAALTAALQLFGIFIVKTYICV